MTSSHSRHGKTHFDDVARRYSGEQPLLDALVEMQRHTGEEAVGGLRELGATAAVVTLRTRATLAEGDALGLRFRLPAWSEVQVHARIRWVHVCATAEGPAAYGVELRGVEGALRNAIDAFGATKTDDCAGSLAVSITERFFVRRSPGRLLLWVNGALNRTETAELRRLLLSRLEQHPDFSVLVYVDARRWLACPAETLFGLCHGLLGERRRIAGVLLVHGALMTGIVRRLASEAGVDDRLHACENAREAADFWRRLERTEAFARSAG